MATALNRDCTRELRKTGIVCPDFAVALVMLELSCVYDSSTEASGVPPYDPAMMLKLLVFAYSIGVTNSRRWNGVANVAGLLSTDYLRIQMTYDLRLRLHGLIERIPPTNYDDATTPAETP